MSNATTALFWSRTVTGLAGLAAVCFLIQSGHDRWAVAILIIETVLRGQRKRDA
jgi:hypothetical protein